MVFKGETPPNRTITTSWRNPPVMRAGANSIQNYTLNNGLSDAGINELKRWWEAEKNRKKNELDKGYPLGYVIFGVGTGREEVVPFDSLLDRTVAIHWNEGHPYFRITKEMWEFTLPGISVYSADGPEALRIANFNFRGDRGPGSPFMLFPNIDTLGTNKALLSTVQLLDESDRGAVVVWGFKTVSSPMFPQ